MPQRIVGQVALATLRIGGGRRIAAISENLPSSIFSSSDAMHGIATREQP
jgi:hypothetical protein